MVWAVLACGAIVAVAEPPTIALLVLGLQLPVFAMAVAALAGAVWLVGFVHAFNFMDGVNGISGAHALIGGVAYACLEWWRRDGFGAADGVPAEAVAGPVALYLADVAWTLQRRIRRGERWLEAHRTHVYQRWCDAGWSHQEVALLTSALTVLLCLLCLLGVAGVLGGTAVRVTADLADLVVLAVYLGSPGLFSQAGLREA